MCAAIFERAQFAVVAAIQRDRLFPELDFHDSTGLHSAVIFDGIPVIRIEAGGPGFLP